MTGTQHHPAVKLKKSITWAQPEDIWLLWSQVHLMFRDRSLIMVWWECWSLQTVPTASVIFTVKASLDVFILSQEQVWTFSVSGDQIYEMRCLFVVVGLNARFKVLPHWDNMSQAHMLTQPVTLYWHRVDQLCYLVPTSS